MTLPSEIDGLQVFPLKKIAGPKGAVLHVMKSSDPFFEKFGEVYISITNPEEIKGWKYHKQMAQNFVVPVGEIHFVFYDDRQNSPTRGVVKKVEAGYDKYVLIQVPPQIWYSFKAVGNIPAHIVNCATLEHHPDESMTLDLGTNKIPYQWHSGQ